MPQHTQEQVLEMLLKFAEDIKLKRKIMYLEYREDYRDYLIVLDDTHHCEIREKLIEMYFQNKGSEAKKEIRFRLEHPTAYEDWEKAGGESGPGDDRIDVDHEL